MLPLPDLSLSGYLLTCPINSQGVAHVKYPREEAGACRSTRLQAVEKVSPRDGGNGEAPENGLESLLRQENGPLFSRPPAGELLREN